MRLMRLAWRWFQRDWRAGELTVLGFAVLIAVAALTSVNAFTDRVGRALTAQANTLLAADLVLMGTDPLPPAWEAQAKQRGLRVAHTINFPSMVMHGGQAQLVALKGVSPDYPLRGEILTSDRIGGADSATTQGPARGELWADSRLFGGLAVKIGESVNVGDRAFRVSRVLTREPDNAVYFFNISPRIIIRQDELQATGLIQPGSRVRYRMLVAGTPAQVTAFKSWLEPQLRRGQRIETIDDTRPEVRSALDRAQQFLALAALATALLAAVAIALGTRRYTERHLDSTALLRCFGASQRDTLVIFLWQFAALGIISALLGVAVGYVAQGPITHWLAGDLAQSLPPPLITPAIWGVLFGLLLLFGFALPPLLRLHRVPTLRVIRRDLPAPGMSRWLTAALGIGAIATLAIVQTGQVQLGLVVLGGMVGVWVSSMILGGLLLALAGRLRDRLPTAWKLGLQALRRRRALSLAQLGALALGALAMLLLTVVRHDILLGWERNLPPDAPNRFIINIAPEQQQPVAQWIQSRIGTEAAMYPMVRARLLSIGGKPVNPESYDDEQARRQAEREFNLSAMAMSPTEHQVVAGKAWTAASGQAPQFSVEANFAKRLGIRLGDTLEFDIAGTRMVAPVTSLRKVAWDSFRVNFFVIASPGSLDGHPSTFVTSFHVPRDKTELMHELVRHYSNLTVIDVSSVIQEIRSMIDRVSHAVEFLFLFTLAAGFVVLYAALVATRDQRLYEIALLRTLGAGRRQVLTSLLTELGVIGLTAGVVAALGAGITGYVVSQQVLNLPWQPNVTALLLGVALTTLGTLAAGLPGVFRTLRQAPMATLRSSLAE